MIWILLCLFAYVAGFVAAYVSLEWVNDGAMERDPPWMVAARWPVTFLFVVAVAAAFLVANCFRGKG